MPGMPPASLHLVLPEKLKGEKCERVELTKTFFGQGTVHTPHHLKADVQQGKFYHGNYETLMQ